MGATGKTRYRQPGLKQAWLLRLEHQVLYNMALHTPCADVPTLVQRRPPSEAVDVVWLVEETQKCFLRILS
jgi:hypothetical protein